MNLQKKLWVILVPIAILVIVSVSVKLKPIINSYDTFNPQKVYSVNYRYFFKAEQKNTFIKTFIPQSNSRQRIYSEKINADKGITFRKKKINTNQRLIWNTQDEQNYFTVNYGFTFQGKSKSFVLPKFFLDSSEVDIKYLKPTENIQSLHPEISALAQQLKLGTTTDRQVISKIFTYVNEIPSAPIITLTDALTTLKRNKASCNGKSRLMVALARNLGYPARVKGGLILEKSKKRTSHVWIEIWVKDTWVSFDALNNHFAFLPSNYLEIYEGDEFLITHTPGIQFDYIYEIAQTNHIAFLNMNSAQISELPGFTLWSIVKSGVLPKSALNLLLLLPLGGLLIAFLRNVVGIKTFGVFLPVLISFSLLHTGFISGLGLFTILILLVAILSYPIDKLGLLYTPKLVICLTIMVGLIIGATSIGIRYNIHWLTTLSFFPTIILTIAAERFSRATVEDGYQIALEKLLQTLIATTICYAVLSPSMLVSILIIFPEIILLTVLASVLLGRYIGLRWTEVFRFKPLLKKTEVHAIQNS